MNCNKFFIENVQLKFDIIRKKINLTKKFPRNILSYISNCSVKHFVRKFEFSGKSYILVAF